MSNPLLNERYFQGGAQTSAVATPGQAPPGYGSPGWGQAIPPAPDNQGSPWPPPTTPGSGRTMTMGGVTSATAALLGLVAVGGWFGWGKVTEQTSTDLAGRVFTTVDFPTVWVFGPMLVAFALALVCSFKPPLARFLAPVYAVVEGVFLGAISHSYDARFDGVVVQAILATAGVFLMMLALYGLRILRATPRFTKGVIAATFGVMAVYAVGWIASLFGADLRFWDSAGPLGIGISLVVVTIASLNLILDFDFIERGSKAGLPAHMEWFAAFGLLVTLVWLYLELLRLMSKLQQR